MKWLSTLWSKTKNIASMYTGTFILVMFLNQLLFFGLCLNPICLIAAMPHVLLITVFLGTWFNKLNNWGRNDLTSNSSGNSQEKIVTNLDGKSEYIPDKVDTKNAGDIKFEKTPSPFIAKEELKLLSPLKVGKPVDLTDISKNSNSAKQVLREKDYRTTEKPIKREILKLNPRKKTVHKLSNEEQFLPSLDKQRKIEKLNKQTEEMKFEKTPSSFIAKEELKLSPPLKVGKDVYLTDIHQDSNSVKQVSSSFDIQRKIDELKKYKFYEISLIEYQGISFLKEKHKIEIKYKLREKILKHSAEPDETSIENSSSYLSTTMLCKVNNIKAKPHFFNHLVKLELLNYKNKEYQLTEKGVLFGGKYKNNGKNERWVVWSNEHLHTVALNYKKSLIEKLDIDSLMHMTHFNNLRSILDKGLLPHNNTSQTIDISNSIVNARRARQENIHNHSIHDYVPFYFNVKNAMLYQVQKEFGSNVVILSFKKEVILSPKVIFSNGNAAARDSVFSFDINDLLQYDWVSVFKTEWSVRGISNVTVKSKMMTECLIHEKVQINNIQSIYCQNNKIKEKVISICNDVHREIDIIVKPSLFF